MISAVIIHFQLIQKIINPNLFFLTPLFIFRTSVI